MRSAIKFCFLLLVLSASAKGESFYFEHGLRVEGERPSFRIVEITPEARIRVGNNRPGVLQANREQATSWRATFFEYVKAEYKHEYGEYENIPAGFRRDIECINSNHTSIIALMEGNTIIHIAVIAYGQLPLEVRLARAGYTGIVRGELAPLWTNLTHQDPLGHIAPTTMNSLIASARPYVGEEVVEIKLVIKAKAYRDGNVYPWSMYALQSRISAGIGLWGVEPVPITFSNLRATNAELARYLTAVRPVITAHRFDPRMEHDIRAHALADPSQETALIGYLYAEAIGRAKIRMWEALGLEVVWRGEDPDFSTEKEKVPVAVLRIHRERFNPLLGEKFATRIPDELFARMAITPTMEGLCGSLLYQFGFRPIPLLGNSSSVVGQIILR